MNGERPTSRRRRAGTLLAFLTLAVAAGACTGPHKIHRTNPGDGSSVNLQYEDDFGAPAPFVADAPAGSAGSAPGAGIVRPGGGASEGRPAPRQQAALPPADRRTAAEIDPAEIVGLSREKVIDRLGAPSFVRREASAEFWRYRADDCIVELYFYRRGEVRVLDHLETRLRRSATPRPGEHSPRACLGAVAADKGRR